MSPAPRIHLFVLIDALGWRYVKERAFLSETLPYRTRLRTVLGYSSGAIPSILTGRTPAEHGHWNLLCYDPEASPFAWLRPALRLPPRVLDHRVSRRLLKELGRRVLGLGPLFEGAVQPRLLPWFDWIEKRSIYTPGGIAGAESIFDLAARLGVSARVYSYHDGSDARLLAAAARDVGADRSPFVFVFLSELDAVLHGHCDDPAAWGPRLDAYAVRLRELLATARALDPGASLTVFSDHGMTPVDEHYDLVAEIDALGFAMPDDYLAVYDSTMARFWFFSERARDKIVGHLQALRCGRILADEELEALGVFFPDRRYGEVIALLDPGVIFARSDFNGQGWTPRGMHGYHPDDPESDAVFLSSVTPSRPPTSILDVFECMREAVTRAVALERSA